MHQTVHYPDVPTETYDGSGDTYSVNTRGVWVRTFRFRTASARNAYDVLRSIVS